MNEIWTLIEATALAGIGGTGLGGLIGALFKKDSKKTVSLLLSFAGGVMTAIVCFDLIVSAVDTKTNIFIISAGICIGVLLVYLLNLFIDRATNHEVRHINQSHPQTADDLDEIIHSNHLSAHIEKKDTAFSLFVAGVFMGRGNCLDKGTERKNIRGSFFKKGGGFKGGGGGFCGVIRGD